MTKKQREFFRLDLERVLLLFLFRPPQNQMEIPLDFFIFVGILQRLSSTNNPVLVVISIVVVVVVFFHLSPIPVSTSALLFN